MLGVVSMNQIKNIKQNNLLTIQEFAKLANVSVQSVYKRLNNSLNPFLQQVDNQKMLEIRALTEIYGIEVEQPFKPELNNLLNSDEVKFLRKQIELLYAELEKEREHNREKDNKLLETLSKLADSQSSLIAGQTADKQKALAEKILDSVAITKDQPELLSSTMTQENIPIKGGWKFWKKKQVTY